MLITLDEIEQELCKKIAEKRFQANRENHVVDARLDSSGELLDLNGFGAELAFCKMFNLYPDLTISIRKGGYDVLSRKGLRIDVKATRYLNGKLIATVKKDINEADIYVLMVGEFPSYRFAGFSFANNLIKSENITDLGHGSTYALPQEKLEILTDAEIEEISKAIL